MSDEYIEKHALVVELKKRIDRLDGEKRAAKKEDDTFAAMRAQHKATALRAVYKFVKKWESHEQCSSCRGEGSTPGGENGFLEPGGYCHSCDGTGKKKRTIYG
jgi:DnaJ-class molecular chaperone